jgi:hypothetical protein
MRRSLRFRLLALSLTVALGAVAATAVLATYSAGEQLQGEIESSASLLESDQSIYLELTGYATEHATWQDVGALVAAAAERTGRRIALTDPRRRRHTIGACGNDRRGRTVQRPDRSVHPDGQGWRGRHRRLGRRRKIPVAVLAADRGRASAAGGAREVRDSVSAEPG